MNPLLIAGLAAMAAPGLVQSIMSLFTERSLGKKQLNLQEKMFASEQETAKRVNEANRQDTERYLGMAREEKKEQQLKDSRDRQMQLLAVMLNAAGAYRSQTAQNFVEGQRTAPPMAMTTLMRGW